MSKSRDNVDSEGNQKSTDGGVNRTEEWEDDSQEPNWNDDRQSSQCSQANAFGVVHSYHLLPNEVQRRARKSKCDELRTQFFCFFVSYMKCTRKGLRLIFIIKLTW